MAANRYMRKVTVKRVDLLEKLKTNRVKHVENYNKAVEEYKVAALVEIEEKREEASKFFDNLKAKLEKDPTVPLEDASLLFDLSPPKSYENNYDEIIEMFEMEVNDTVELDSTEFSQYVMDNWDWKGQLENQRIFYAAKSVGFAPQ